MSTVCRRFCYCFFSPFAQKADGSQNRYIVIKKKAKKKEDDMNHSLRPPENNYLMLVLTKQTIQSIVITNVIPSITVVSESNNIIFTLNLSNY